MADDDNNDNKPPVVIPIEDSIDLHAFAPKDIPSVVESYLEAAREAAFAEAGGTRGRACEALSASCGPAEAVLRG